MVAMSSALKRIAAIVSAAPAIEGIAAESARAPDALAKLRLVDGDPTTNIKIREDSAKYLLVIMKDGKICKYRPPN